MMYHMFASGVELGSYTLRRCSAYGPTVVCRAGCAKDDSIERYHQESQLLCARDVQFLS